MTIHPRVYIGCQQEHVAFHSLSLGQHSCSISSKWSLQKIAYTVTIAKETTLRFSLWNSEPSLHFCCHCILSEYGGSMDHHGAASGRPDLTPQSYQPHSTKLMLISWSNIPQCLVTFKKNGVKGNKDYVFCWRGYIYIYCIYIALSESGVHLFFWGAAKNVGQPSATKQLQGCSLIRRQHSTHKKQKTWNTWRHWDSPSISHTKKSEQNGCDILKNIVILSKIKHLRGNLQKISTNLHDSQGILPFALRSNWSL